MSERENQFQPEVSDEPTGEVEESTEFPLNPLADTEEFKFHQDRFEKKAEKHNTRGVVRRIAQKAIFGTDARNLSKVDVAHEEALRENAYFDRLKDDEMKEWENSRLAVLEHMKAVKNDPEGEGKKYRIVLLIPGGGMRVAASAGQLMAFNDAGFNKNIFKAVIGISGGAGVGIGFMDKPERGRKAASIFYEECGDPEFINQLRVSHIMDANHIGDALETGDKAVDKDEVLSPGPEFFVAVTKKKKGGSDKAELINAKMAKPNVVRAVTASMNVPLLFAPGVEVNGEEWVDGAFDPLPIREIIDRFKPTDIVVLPNVPFDKLETFKPNMLEEFGSLLPRAGTLGTMKKFFKMALGLRKSLESYKQEEGVNIGLFWPPDCGLTTVTTDRGTVKTAVYESYRSAMKQLGKPAPQRVEIYESKKYKSLDLE